MVDCARHGGAVCESFTVTVTFNHIIVVSADRDTAADFYRDLFELDEGPAWGPFRNLLLDRGYHLVEVPDAEFDSMGCNVLALAPRLCLMVAGNPVTRSRLEAAGCTVLEYAGAHISVKGGGGPTCLTRPLWRYK